MIKQSRPSFLLSYSPLKLIYSLNNFGNQIEGTAVGKLKNKIKDALHFEHHINKQYKFENYTLTMNNLIVRTIVSLELHKLSGRKH